MASAQLSAQGQLDLRRACKTMEMTQEAWAREAHVSVSTLKRFIAGKPVSKSTFQCLCEVLGLTEWKSLIDTPDIVDSTRFPSRPGEIYQDKESKPIAALVVRGTFDQSKQLQIKALLEALKDLLLESKIIIQFPEDQSHE
ncbi:MAG: helix-turn-helix transcriptional regulator [Cyanobacteria bacterium P01_F01_bin.86]